MDEIRAKRVMIAAPKSGSGKTTVTCALLGALKKAGKDPLSFKCGPDYIDPLFHEEILKTKCRNLDTYFSGKEGVMGILSSAGESYAVLEGVMGLYDGLSPDSIEGSSYEIAALTDTPIILVIDASGVGRSVISLIKGMLSDDEGRLIKGIILNRMSGNFHERLRPVLEEELLKIREDVKLLGFLPKDEKASIKSRHLGLTLPEDISKIEKKLSEAEELLCKNADLSAIIGIMEASPKKGSERIRPLSGDKIGKDLCLAVAYDKAFCFYYRDNLELFERQGVRIEYFSPIKDERIPEGADGLLLGGGYPEYHLEALSRNSSMLSSVREVIDRGIPSLAECGGFMYLHKKVSGTDGKAFELAGVIDGECYYTGHSVRFGYMMIRDTAGEYENDRLYPKLVGMKGHEFHYCESTKTGGAFLASKSDGSGERKCMIAQNNGLWGFPHFYYGSDPEFVTAFIQRMREVRGG